MFKRPAIQANGIVVFDRNSQASSTFPGSPLLRSLTGRRQEAKPQGTERWRGKDLGSDIPQQVEGPTSGNCCVSAPLRLCVDSRLLGITGGPPACPAGLNSGIVSFLSQHYGFAGFVGGIGGRLANLATLRLATGWLLEKRRTFWALSVVHALRRS
jgi:hypothetical protein